MKKSKKIKLSKKIMAFATALILGTCSLGNVVGFADTNNHVSVYVNDNLLGFDVQPEIENGRTMVPMRAIFEALGANVTWDEGTQTAVGVKDGVTVSLTIGSNVMYKNDSTVQLDSAPIIISDRTLMPLRAISEAYGFDVNWDDPTKTAYIGSHNRLDLLKNKVQSMSLDDKIYQMMIVTPEAITGVDAATAAGDATKNALQQYPVGGLIYFAKNIESYDQLKSMIANSQSYSSTPLFMSIDEEGGRVSRLGNAGIGVNKYPPMKEIGDTNDPTKAAEVGTGLAANLKGLGFNVDFAPDSDVADVQNSAIGDRSFGSDPSLVSSMIQAEITAMQVGGVSACMKHFPGLGSSTGDTHDGFVRTEKSLQDLNLVEFVPFRGGADVGCDFTMVGHISAPNVTGNNIPSSMSSMMIGILRNDIGFSGLVITDALNMGAIIQNYTTTEACVGAITAGVDILLMPNDIGEAHYAIGKAVQDGEISPDRIDESIMRILDKKMSRGLIQ